MKAMDLPGILEPYRKVIEESVQPFIRIKAEAGQKSDFTQSKFGGLPYLPKNYGYPTDQQGKPMILLAQIDFASLPPLDPFPHNGLLQFYIADDTMYGLNLDDPTDQSNFRLVYFNEIYPENAMTDFNFLPGFDNSPITQTYALLFEQARAPVGTEDIHFDMAFGDSSYTFFKNLGEKGQEIKKEYNHLFSARGHKMGGYAHLTQEDPRWIHQDFAEAILLLQIDSDHHGICWGDQGIAQFFILSEDLQKLDFSKVLFNWDSP